VRSNAVHLPSDLIAAIAAIFFRFRVGFGWFWFWLLSCFVLLAFSAALFSLLAARWRALALDFLQ
jgi:hypothetical protein